MFFNHKNSFLLAFVATCCMSHSHAVQAATITEDELLSAARLSTEAPDTLGAGSELERRALNAAGSAVRRDGGRLTLSLRNGDTTFIDAPKCQDISKERDCGVFKLLAYAKSRKLYVLQHSWYGGVAYVLVDTAIGTEARFADLPYLSPSGDFVAGQALFGVRGPDQKEYPNPHIEISVRWPSGRYTWAWEGAPHYPNAGPKNAGKVKYVIEKWFNDDASIDAFERPIEFDSYIEIDEKVAARFRVRPRNTTAEVVDIP